MSQQDKAAYFQALKASGVQFEKHYREYKTDELRKAWERLNAEGQAAPLQAGEEPEDHPEPETPPQPIDPQAAEFFGFTAPAAAPTMTRDSAEMAGARLNAKEDDEPIRVDPDTGFTWYQEEILKPAFPKPRGRRVLKYMDPGVQVQTVKAGEYQESFEVPGDMAHAREAEVKITLPSYQVGIYQDPRFPFKTVCYNGNEGFKLEDVRRFYGGAQLVPAEVKLKYVENVLCYDMPSVIQAIEAEHRRLMLASTGRIS